MAIAIAMAVAMATTKAAAGASPPPVVAEATAFGQAMLTTLHLVVDAIDTHCVQWVAKQVAARTAAGVTSSRPLGRRSGAPIQLLYVARPPGGSAARRRHALRRRRPRGARGVARQRAIARSSELESALRARHRFRHESDLRALAAAPCARLGEAWRLDRRGREVAGLVRRA